MNNKSVYGEMIVEVLKHRKPSDFQRELRSFLYELHLLDNGSTEIKKQLRSFGFNGFDFSLPKLKGLYGRLHGRKVFQDLDLRYQANPTASENHIVDLLRRQTKAHIYQSFWIGNHCIDIFIPSRRVLIEIDGGIHNAEPKMRKDNFKESFLEENFSLHIVRIENNQRNSKMFVTGILNSYKPICTKTKNRLIRDVIIHTVSLDFKSEEDIEAFFGNNFLKAFQNYQVTKFQLDKRRGRHA